jgi:hypothetical protein
MDTDIARGLLSFFDVSSASFLHPENKHSRLIWAVGLPDVMLPVFYLSSRFLHNPISSNISLMAALINRGGLVIDK